MQIWNIKHARLSVNALHGAIRTSLGPFLVKSLDSVNREEAVANMDSLRLSHGGFKSKTPTLHSVPFSNQPSLIWPI